MKNTEITNLQLLEPSSQNGLGQLAEECEALCEDVKGDQLLSARKRKEIPEIGTDI